ncbi:M15 family metallopeptidase [Leptolyngbya sp. PCC 6406]|uniref:M15 family metallopeptidase n=1 Tax=Leptolyngbya sp. PCC 6406 TaxID=1173264 RepID=UPI000567E798|nr:M15 family metallopeptidase [Leptolyngbya sp. PCC 6406]
MKPYQYLPILDQGEPLVPIPLDHFAVVTPHPYHALGAPYGDRSPYWLRSAVLSALTQAQSGLQQVYPGWRLQIFDAYRPIPVQQFMVEYAFAALAQQQGQDLASLTAPERDRLRLAVSEFWAVPSLDPATPPPHSTGAAIDLTLLDSAGNPVDMGSPIDELSVRSHPDHFATATHPSAQQAHRHRQILKHAMVAAGFQQHPKEWWHFSLGDQLWAWLVQAQTNQRVTARYGRVEAAIPPG